MRHPFQIVQVNTVTRAVQRNDGRGGISTETITRHPGHVIATHNSHVTCEKHLEKIRVCHPNVAAELKEIR